MLFYVSTDREMYIINIIKINNRPDFLLYAHAMSLEKIRKEIIDD